MTREATRYYSARYLAVRLVVRVLVYSILLAFIIFITTYQFGVTR